MEASALIKAVQGLLDNLDTGRIEIRFTEVDEFNESGTIANVDDLRMALSAEQP